MNSNQIVIMPDSLDKLVREKQMERIKGKLERDGERLVIISDAPHGQTLRTIVTIAKQSDTVVEVAHAEHLVKCWNAFEEGGLVTDLLAACKRGNQRLLEMGQKESHRTVNTLKEAIAKAEKEMKNE